MTANEDLRDSYLRRQIALHRYEAGVLKRVADLLDKANKELVDRLESRLPKTGDLTTKRWKETLAWVLDARSTALASYQQMLNQELGTAADQEAQDTVARLTAASPVDFSFVAATSDQLRSITESKPFQGHLLRDWYDKLQYDDAHAAKAAIQMGLVQGETFDQISKRLLGGGTAAGALAKTRTQAQALAATAVAHVTGTAREMTYAANSDVISFTVWVATLDGRTSPICRARDGAWDPVGSQEVPAGHRRLKPAGATTPAHFRCRSIKVPVLSAQGLLGNRPYVLSTVGGKQRQIDFQAMAKESGRPVSEVRQEWGATHIGTVPASTTYAEWLGRQSSDFQDSVLGKAHAKAFRAGTSLSEFAPK